MKNIIGLFCAFLIFISLSAQEMSKMHLIGTAEFLPGEIIAKDKKDINGEVCAGILIYTDLTGLSFDSRNGIIEVREEAGRYFLFLSHTERLVTVMKAGYSPLDIILRDNGINLVTGAVWKIELSGARKLDMIPINIVTNVGSPQIYIDNELQQTQTSLPVAAGKHTLRIVKDGYKVITEEIDVSISNTFFNYQLEIARPVMITISSNPSGATVFIDGTEKGTTPCQIFQTEGSFTLRLQMYGYLEHEENIVVSETGTKQFNIDLNRNAGILSVTLSPQDARLIIDGEEKTQRALSLTPGRHMIEVKKNNYLSVFDTVNLAIGQSLNREYTLIKNTSGFNLAINPTDANVTLNSLDISTFNLQELPAGKYVLEIIKEGYKPYIETIDIRRGTTFSKSVTLESMRGTLQLSVQPIEANVSLLKNNLRIDNWRGSAFKENLLVGQYEITVDLRGYVSQRRTIEIKENNITTESISLVKSELEFISVKEIRKDGDDIRSVTLDKKENQYIINYYLTGTSDDDYEVQLFLRDSFDESFKMVPASITGDAGEVKGSYSEKTIIWNYTRDIKSRIDNDNLYLQLVVEKAGGGGWIYWVGAAVVGGVVAAVVAGGGSGGNGDQDTPTVTFPTPPVRP